MDLWKLKNIDRAKGFLSLDDLPNNVCFIKIRSKHSSNTLLSLLRIFMKQTLQLLYRYMLEV